MRTIYLYDRGLCLNNGAPFPDNRGLYPGDSGVFLSEGGPFPNDRGLCLIDGGPFPDNRGLYPGDGVPYPNNGGRYTGEIGFHVLQLITIKNIQKKSIKEKKNADLSKINFKISRRKRCGF
jgi:hypothetical protein